MRSKLWATLTTFSPLERSGIHYGRSFAGCSPSTCAVNARRLAQRLMSRNTLSSAAIRLGRRRSRRIARMLSYRLQPSSMFRAPQCQMVPPELIFVGSLAQLYKAPDVLIDAVGDCVRDGLDIGVGAHRQRAISDKVEARAAGAGVGQPGAIPRSVDHP